MAPKAAVKQETRAIERSVLIRADADEIFAALTRSEELEKWFPEHANTDPELGGVFEFGWEKVKVW